MNDLDLWHSQRFMYNLLSYHRVPLFWKNAMYHLFPIQYPKGPNLTLTKMGQGQPRVTIWRNLVVLDQLMLHIKFQANQPSGSEKEDVLRFLPYMGMEPCWSCDHDHLNKSQILILSGCCIWNLIEIGPAVSEEKLIENVYKHSIRVTLGQGHWNDLGLWYSQRCMKHLLSCHRVPLFWKNTMFHLFSIQKPKEPNLTLMKNRSRST